MITSLTEMPELPNLYYTNTCTIEFDSRDKISLVAKNHDITTFFSKCYYFKEVWIVADFADIIKITIMLICSNQVHVAEPMKPLPAPV